MELEKRPVGSDGQRRRRSWAEKVLELLTAKCDQESLRMAAQELGNGARFETEPEVLRKLETGLARLPIESEAARSYALALTDVLSAMVRRLEEEVLDERASHLAKRRAEYLTALSKGTLTPSDIKKVLKKDLGQISRELDELRVAGLVELFAVADGREKPHRLTLRGRRALATTNVGAGWDVEHSRPQALATTTKRVHAGWEVEHSGPERVDVFKRYFRTLVDPNVAPLLADLWRETETPECLRRLTRRAPPDEMALVVRSDLSTSWLMLFVASSFATRWRECSYVNNSVVNGGWGEIPDARYVVLYDDRRQAELDKSSEYGRRLLGMADEAFVVIPTGSQRQTLTLENLS